MCHPASTRPLYARQFVLNRWSKRIWTFSSVASVVTDMIAESITPLTSTGLFITLMNSRPYDDAKACFPAPESNIHIMAPSLPRPRL